MSTPSVDRRHLLSEFAKELYIRKDVAKAFEAYVANDYIQHSPGIADGRAAAVEVLTSKFANPDLHLNVRSILVDGDMAVLLVHGVMAEKQFAVVDIYRLEGDKIVEHWDVNQSYPEQIHNTHPFFSEPIDSF
jgi:predicted SnoaL-like aldol condensation-catalyzing enzyme